MEPAKIVCMGDSLTEGYQIDLSKRWSDLLRKKTGIKFINSGISGDTTGGMLARFQPMVIAHNPTHVIIMGGTNDLALNIPDEQIFANIYAMTRQAKYHAIQSIIGIPTPFYYENTPYGDSFFLQHRRLSDRIENYCNKLRQFIVEDEQPFIDFSIHMTPDLFLSDGVHPCEKGHEVMAVNAQNALKAMMK